MTIDEAFFADELIRVPDDSLGFVLWRATHAWQRTLEQALAPTGLTHLRFAVLIALAWLTRTGDVVSQRQLADFVEVHPMQVSQVVSAMEKAQLLARKASDSDRRALTLSMTATGESVLRQAMPIVAEAHLRFFNRPGIDVEQVRQALRAWLEAP